jgi:hypothetical protein
MPLRFSGPAPAPGRRYCGICAATFKAAALAKLDQAHLTAAERGAADITLPLEGPDPDIAVAIGLAGLPVPPGLPGEGQPAIVPLELCWSHVQAVSILSSNIVAAPAGAVLLGG